MSDLTVTLYEEVWLYKIVRNHPEVEGLLEEAKHTAAAPAIVLASNSVPGTYVFVNTSVQDQTGRYLRMPVKPTPDQPGHAIVTSCYFSGNVKDAGTLIHPAVFPRLDRKK